jgi:hypothetical protein
MKPEDHIGDIKDNTQFVKTASRLVGINGTVFAQYSDFVIQHKLECEMNSYYWKQQDLTLDLALFGQVARSALEARL